MKRKKRTIELAEVSSLAVLGFGGFSPVVRVNTPEELKEYLAKGGAFRILGNGSNVVISDDGISEEIVKLEGGFRRISIKGSVVTAGGGALLKDVIKECAGSSLAGMENLAGIPAAVGGAVFKNAAAFGVSICGLLESISIMDSSGRQHCLRGKKLKYSYRKGPLKRGEILIRAVFRLKKGKKSHIAQRLKKIIKQRASRGLLGRNASGSLFKNSDGASAWSIIRKAGLDRTESGTMSISVKHANIVSFGRRPTASDFFHIMNTVRGGVLKKRNLWLVPLIEFWGNF